MQPAAGGDFRQDVALVEITGSAQALSFNRGAGGHDARLRRRHGDRLAPRAAAASIDGQRSRVRRLRHSRARGRAGTTTQASTCEGKTALILVNDPGLRHRRRSAVSRQGDDLPRSLDLQVRGSLAPGRSGRDHRPRDGCRRPTTGAWSGTAGPARSSTSTARTAMPRAPRSRAGSPRRGRASSWNSRDQDFDSLKEAAAVKRGFRPVELGVTATAGVRNEIRHKRSPNVAGLIPGKDRPEEYVIYMAHWDHLGVDGGWRGRSHLQRRRGQRDGRRRHPDDRACVPGHAAGRVAFGAVSGGHGRGVRPARVRVLRRAPPGAAREDGRRDQHRRAESAGTSARTSRSSDTAPRIWRTCWPLRRSRRSGP